MVPAVKIEKLDSQGRGIGYLDGKILFVPNALPGEVCKVEITKEKRTFLEGEILSYVKVSDQRVNPLCPYYHSCGGCDLEHMSYLDTVHWKSSLLTELFRSSHLYDDDILVEACENPFYYRNKVTLKVVDGKVGFYSSKTHRLVEIDTCAITRNSINAVIQDFSMYAFSEGNLTIRSNENDEILMDLETKDEVQIEKEFVKRHKIVGIFINHRLVYGESFFFERKNGVLYQVSMDSFFQVNPWMSSKLFSYVKEEVGHAQNVLDLYCGVGTLGFQLSSEVSRLTGIEVIPSAILNAIKNAKLNQKNHYSYHLGKVEDIILKIDTSFDVVLIDPPRSGLDKTTRRTILKMKPKQILYVSCNPMTLIRDLKEMKEFYGISKVRGFDMFPYTKHVECCALLSLKENKQAQ